MKVISGNPTAADLRLTVDDTANPAGSKFKEGHRFKIVVDPGHGGKDPGAEGRDGKIEKDYNLSLAMQVYELLRQEPLFEPKLTRSTACTSPPSVANSATRRRSGTRA